MNTPLFTNQHLQKNTFMRNSSRTIRLRDLWLAKTIHTRTPSTSLLPRRSNNCFYRYNYRNVLSLVVSLLIGCVFMAPTFGVAVEDLKAPIADLKNTLFGGWMWIPKIGAAVGGCVLAVYNQSILPLATGAAIGLGIHFYDLYIDASGALI